MGSDISSVTAFVFSLSSARALLFTNALFIYLFFVFCFVVIYNFLIFQFFFINDNDNDVLFFPPFIDIFINMDPSNRRTTLD